MSGAVLVAIAASIGNLLQGWDNATIAGAVLYIKREFKLQNEPTIEGLIVAMSLIGATIITTFSGAVSDWVGRRPMLILSSILYFLGGLIMLWAPNVYMLLLARLIDGFGIGLAVTLVPVYISETAPPEIRGLLNTLPQFSGSGGMFLSYCMVFGMSLMPKPDWRVMLGVLSIPSLLYFALTIFYLPESPRWLVSKGRMVEAKQVLQRLRGREDVAGEMALLVEGLGVGGDTSIEEYIIGPANEPTDEHAAPSDKEQITLYGPEEGLSWVARPVKGSSALGSALALASRHGSMVNQNVPLMDPVVTLFGSVHEKLPETGSTLFPNFGSMFSVAENQPKTEHWDEESIQREGEENYASDNGEGDYDDNNLQSPLLSRQTTCMEGGKDVVVPKSANGSVLSMRRNSSLLQGSSSAVNSMGIGGGWQLAYKWSEKETLDGKKEGGFKRIYLHQEGVQGSRRGSLLSIPGVDAPEEGSEFIHAAALVSQSALYSKELLDQGQRPVGPAMVHPSEAAARGPVWRDLLEPGVKHALLVGVGIQILQQFAGINGVLYYTPQILEQAGVDVLLANIGIRPDSASILISALTTLLMLPAIGVAMRLMDLSGRRFLLLTTIPVLVASLIILVISNVVAMGTVLHAVLSTVSVIVYFCCFVMGFGPIPNILCAEIFPTRVRGICIAICALTFWFGDIIVTYTLPVMLNSIGLAGVFGIYSIVCVAAFIFVFLKVPETKGMPLEVITEFFAVGAKQVQAAKE
ncbi:monosaccharide-sensing protein 2-like [Ananas comosus]|uniref:Monosaccharide-sensing protein 2-like n=2 Tax=Ananas comosus TaxID=4615 RepID=A0A6P5FGQ6_ANACO|nr:monosaccharide-sensing protein 2-like [Ananas comosus]